MIEMRRAPQTVHEAAHSPLRRSVLRPARAVEEGGAGADEREARILFPLAGGSVEGCEGVQG